MQSMDLFFVTTRSGADVLSYPDMNLVRELHSNTFACYALATDPSDRFLATGGADGTVSLWDISECIGNEVTCAL